ncbi:cysteine desulfurase [Roseobacter denitrificans OCh 114]|nr:cysteine desulfurase [Roseobacter denitrificans OCh 114]
MLEVMDLPGNPSSVHAEGRAAKGMMERARRDIAEALGAQDAEIVFTSGATEAAALACAGRNLRASDIEHDAVRAWCPPLLDTDAQGGVTVDDPAQSTLQRANSETGILQDLPQDLAVSDMTQAFGKIPLDFTASGARMALISAHKLGGPKGIGALILRRGQDIPVQIKGGGQEMGRRSGTENLIGIAGFAAAAQAARRDLDAGRWEEIKELRKILENTLAAETKTTIFIGKEANRLPNTLCFATPGWKGEAQVIQMDLAGFAVSAGSACSSGKVKASSVLRAMGLDEATASCAIRVSLGLETTKTEVLQFAQAWLEKEKKFRARAA